MLKRVVAVSIISNLCGLFFVQSSQFTIATARVYNVVMKQGGGKVAIRKEKRTMADYITTRQYADLHGIPLETVRTWTKLKKIPFIKVGDSIMIDRSEPLPAKRKPGRKTVEEKVVAEVNSKILRVEITHAYYVAVVDNSGKEIVSDFTFLSKAEAEKLGAKMKKEIESRGEQ